MNRNNVISLRKFFGQAVGGIKEPLLQGGSMSEENLLENAVRSQCRSIWAPGVLDKIAKCRNLIKRLGECRGINLMAAASVMF